MQVGTTELRRGGESSLIENPLFEGTQGKSPSVSRHISDPTGGPSESRAQALLRGGIKRSKSMKEYLQKSTSSFFGLNKDTERRSYQRWTERRRRLLSKKCGELKDSNSDGQSSPTPCPIHDPYAPELSSSDWTDSPSKPPSQQPLIFIKDPVYKMIWDGIQFVRTTVTKLLASQAEPSHIHPRRTRSYEIPPPSSDDAQTSFSMPTGHLTDELFFDNRPFEPWMEKRVTSENGSQDMVDYSRSLSHQWHPSVRAVPPSHEVGLKRIWNKLLDKPLDNSDRRQYGMGLVGRLFNRKIRKERLTSDVKKQLDDLYDHRPFFTYWVTTVQILVTIVSLAVYGFGPVGFHMTRKSGLVLVTSLSLQEVDYFEPDNFWIGPRAADLVHLGAKFTPCMRKDKKIHAVIQKERENERNTACCVRNDHSGCVQTSRDKCSTRGLMAGEIISTWKKWDISQPGPPRWVDSRGGGIVGAERSTAMRRLSGSVCGQDPRHCQEPASVYPYEWPDDITRWPVCRHSTAGSESGNEQAHMACEVIGRPCCVGIYGDCLITTKEYCDFVKGFFHEEAALCSQVSCMDDVCGMIPFYRPDVPDQFYRLWTSLFLHAGLAHLLLTVIVQYFIMRDLEKLTGSLRMAIIYLVSGVAGNLASAIFVPYRAEVGPAGSQFGLLACLVVEVIHCWRMLQRPGRALARLGGVALTLFVIGLLPWVDNYAHLFGFVFGFLVSFALLPFVTFGAYDRTTKVILIWACLVAVVALLAGLVVLFYVHPIYECSFCKYLNCIPLTADFCVNQDTNFTRREY